MQTTNANANTSLRLDVIGAGGVGGSNIIGQCEMHDGKTIDQVEGSAPIFTGSVAVTNPEVRLDWPIANHSNVQAAWYMEVTHAVDFPGGTSLLGLMGSGTALMWERADAGFRTFDGTNHHQVPIVSTPGVPVKLGLAYAAADLQQRLTADGVNGLDVVYDGAFQNSGLTFPGALAMVRLIRNIRRYDLPYVEAKAKIDELMAL
jgi:hypothetical protein